LLSFPTLSCQSAPPPLPPVEEEPEGIRLVEIQDRIGLSFLHRHGGTGQKYMVETLGSGGGVIDYDGDGLEDLYLVQGGVLPGYRPESPLRNALFRNQGDGTFRDVTEEARAGGKPWGMGFCSGDIDNDGDPDIYLSNFGPDVLLINEGDGTFRDATAEVGIVNPLWGASCALSDVNGDGALDIYVTNYVDYTLEKNKRCETTEGERGYCHPDVYDGTSGVLFRNNMDGTFSDVTRSVGLHEPEGKGLGAVFSDYDGDDDLDLYVANDAVANFLFANDGQGLFTEEGLFAGVAYSERGETQAGMGVAIADMDGDGDPDIFVTNLDMETNAFYRNRGDSTFSYDSWAAGLGEPSILFVGFGTSLLDLDNDGDLDVFVANGHVNEFGSQKVLTFRQRSHLFINDGAGQFQERGEEFSEFFRWEGVARGSATFDLERDGDLDLLVTYNNDRARLLRNEGRGYGHWLRAKLIGRRSNRDGVGARLRVRAGDLTVTREIQAGNSYLSQSSPVAHFGLGEATRVDRMEIRWPSGQIQVFEGLEVDRLLVIGEEEGIR
jgi:hypothetical protein